MGNICQSSQLRLREEFQHCNARKRGVQELRHALHEFRSQTRTPMVMTFDAYQGIFQEQDDLAKRQFVLLCERCSVTDRIRPNKVARGSTMTIFSIMCFLCCACPKDKARFMFELFDLNSSTSLTHDEVVVLLTCLFRAMCTLDVDNTQYCDAASIDSMAKEPFIMATLEPSRDHLLWNSFWKWAKGCMRLNVFSICLLGTRFPSPVRRSKSSQKSWEPRQPSPVKNPRATWKKPSRRWTVTTTQEVQAREEHAINPVTSSDSSIPADIWQNPTEEEEELLRHLEQQRKLYDMESGSGLNNSTCSSDKCSARTFESLDLYTAEFQSRDSPQEAVGRFEAEPEMRGDRAMPQDNDNRRPEVPEVQHTSPSRSSTGDCLPSARSAESFGEGTEDNMDAQAAVQQILSCLPDIEEGNLEALPWVLDALGLLSKCGDCVHLKPAIPQVLPLICNVAACDDPALSSDALLILAALLEGAPEVFPLCVEAVNDKALVEMCLLKSSDAEIGVAAAADCCLEQIAASVPYGLGGTIAGLLEAGTLHENPTVVATCANTVDKCLEASIAQATLIGERQDLPPQEVLGPDLEGRAGLLLSALSIWAHGENELAHDAARLSVLRLSLHFNGNDEWNRSIDAAESPVLYSWHTGGAGTSAGFAQGLQLVPAGKMAARRCPPDATMYPQVFALLGFKGRGGAACGISPQTEFDCNGSFRKRETVVERRVVEITKVMDNGRLQTWVEEEEHTKEVTLLQGGVGGHFAKREKVTLAQREIKDGETVTEQTENKDFVHFKNEKGEFASFIKPSEQMETKTRPPMVNTQVPTSKSAMIPSPRRYSRSPTKRSSKFGPKIKIISSTFGVPMNTEPTAPSLYSETEAIPEIITECDVEEPHD